MKWSDYLLPGLLGFGLVLLVSGYQASPGYMDADYYMAGGMSLARGSGFSDFFLWNFLADPEGIPTPSHAYWMPLGSLLSALGMVITGVVNFASARIFFLLVAALIAPLTMGLSYSIYRNREYARLAGLIAAVPGFYLAYLGTTDTFGIYMVLGCAWFLILSHEPFKPGVRFLLLGVLSGLLHLSRADGILWLFLGVIYILTAKPLDKSSPDGGGAAKTALILAFGALMAGYLLIMLPWILRNISAFGTPLSPGGIRALWLIHYDDIYAYPGDQITFSRWWASGLLSIFRVRWHALGINLQTALAVQGGIFLAPLMIVGLWQVRQLRAVRFGLIIWLMTLLLMTGAFPEVGWRGGFFHSGAAIQPLFWAAAPVGLAEFIRLGVRVRRWNYQKAWSFFRSGSIVLLLIVTLSSTGKRLTDFRLPVNAWDQSNENYARIEAELSKLGAIEDDIVLVNNPPGYFVATGRKAISIPDGGMLTLLAVAERYGGAYLILEPNHPQELDSLYNQEEIHARLQLVSIILDTYLYHINNHE